MKLEFLESVWVELERYRLIKPPLSGVIHPTYAVTYINTIGRDMYEDLKRCWC